MIHPDHDAGDEDRALDVRDTVEQAMAALRAHGGPVDSDYARELVCKLIDSTEGLDELLDHIPVNPHLRLVGADEVVDGGA